MDSLVTLSDPASKKMKISLLEILKILIFGQKSYITNQPLKIVNPMINWNFCCFISEKANF